MKNKKNEKLFRLSELSDYKVASDDPDVSGWDLKDRDGRVVGAVNSLIVNKEIEKVVYLDIDMDSSVIESEHKTLDKSAKDGIHEFQNKKGENHLILPIGLARLNEDEKFVYANELTHQTFAETKRYDRSKPIKREYEKYIVGQFSKKDKEDRDFYDREVFDSSRYRKR